MAAVFWFLVLGAGLVTGQPWAFLIFAVLLICFGLARISERPAKVAPSPRSVEAPKAEAPAVDTRQLKRRWRAEDLQTWQDEYDTLLARCG